MNYKLKMPFATCLFLILLIFNSCSKKTEMILLENQIERSFIVNKIITDSAFHDLVYTYISESHKLMNDSNNFNLISNSNYNLQLAMTSFLIHNPEFVSINQTERLLVLQNIRDSFNSKSTFIQHPNHKIKLFIEKINTIKINERVLRIYSNNTSRNIVQQINSEDIIECAIGALANGIASYGEIFKDIRSIIRSGVSTSLAIDLTLDLIRNASPWWKVGSIVLSFGACLYF